MKSIHYIVFLCLIPFSLTACFRVNGTLEEQLSNIPWPAINLEDQGCQNISGTYKSKETVLLGQFDLRNSWFDNRNNTYENYKEVPFVPVIKTKKPMPGQKFSPDDTTYVYSDSTDFYEKSYTLIQHTRNALTISLIGQEGTLYKQYKILVSPPHMGCYKGELVIRIANAIGGTEGGLGSAYATESHFRKLSDGSLEVHIQSREWYYSSFRGLIGIDTEGRASGVEPRKRDVLLIFPQADKELGVNIGKGFDPGSKLTLQQENGARLSR